MRKGLVGIVLMFLLLAGCAGTSAHITEYREDGTVAKECEFAYNNLWKDLTEAEVSICGGVGSVRQSSPNAQALNSMMQMFQLMKPFLMAPPVAP